MRAYVRVQLHDHEPVDLCPGDLLGRLTSAALRVDDARVSEAHALVSLRGAELKLLALRGVLAVDGRRVPEVVLEEGQRIHLARDLVLEVEIPETTLALRVPGLPPQVLRASVHSVVVSPAPGVVPRYQPEAPAHVFSSGDAWRIRRGEGEAMVLAEGDRFDVAGVEVSVVSVPVGRAAADETRGAGRLYAPMKLIAHFDTFHIHRRGHEPLALGGLSARILSELVGFGGPVDWEVVAREIWSGDEARFSLRRKCDVNLARLRRKLRAAGVRPDLVRADGTGHIELLLRPDDTVEDRT